ncbi:pathogenesis-related protein 1B-like [Rutidosis leptorrhynchoides]|uniref:pathogenesis-related protein 1B-like n=1 Tax=Rutidosis leptorrhynchoides TaxID=125765 RepID=UPI003A98FFE3
MGHWYNISFYLVLSMAILHLSHAHDAGNSQEDYVSVHNCIRKVLNIPPLQYDPALEQAAQAWADQRKDCKLIHSDKCGENMAYGPSLNITYAVQMWLDERRDYDCKENKCKKMCGHYTQIVWKNTQRVGCARSPCSDGTCFVVVCNYDPPGNVVGEVPY